MMAGRAPPIHTARFVAGSKWAPLRVRSGIRWYRSFRPPADLAHTLVCTWQARVGGPHRLIPDGCVDLLWLDDGRLTVCGPEVRSWSFHLAPGTEAVGVRFRPGVAAGALRQPMAELLDRRVALEDLVGSATTRRLGDHLADGAGDAGAQRRAFEAFARRLVADDPTDRETAVVARLVDRRCVEVADLAGVVGLSTRQLHRRCTAAFGYGPATLSRILRFQRFVHAVMETPPGRSVALAGLAADAGFADQAHLSRECRTITGETPTALVATLPDTSVETIPDLGALGALDATASERPIRSRPARRQGASSWDDADRRSHPEAVRRLRGQGGDRSTRALVEPLAV